MATTGTFGYRTAREGGVKVEGLSSVQRQLKKLSEDVDYQAAEFLSVNKTIAAAVAGDSKAFVPVLSGALASSVREAATKKSARVKAGGGLSSAQRALVGGYGVGRGSIQYAGPIHFGWPARRIKPQPFFYDAIDKRRDEIKERYEKLVDTLIKKHDLEDKRIR